MNNNEQSGYAMPRYLGIKLIQATEMSQGDALNKGLIKLPKDEQGNTIGVSNERHSEMYATSGYLVIYEDGYESWSPKDVFEKAYKQSKKLEDWGGGVLKAGHETRVYEEAEELAIKIDKLAEFIENTPTFIDLPQNEQNLLKQQLMAMQYYLTVLIERMEIFISK